MYACQTGFDPVRCYEELRINILEDSFYSSWGRDVLQNRGMSIWLNAINMINTRMAAHEMPDPVLNSEHPTDLRRDEELSVRSKLKMLLADITAALYREAIYV